MFDSYCNVLTNISKVNAYPFPYAGTFECFPKEIYNELVKTRPSWQAIAGDKKDANNRRADISAHFLKDSDNLHPLWKQFVDYHSSHDFYLQILDRFEFYFKDFYPKLGDMRQYKTAKRYSGEDADIYMDCQLSVNTPVKEKCTVNNPHVDHPRELFASLLYMKTEDDNAGGDLEFYKTVRPIKFHGKREADLDCIRKVMRIPYSPNAYVCFVNSPLSVHGVTEREVTSNARLMVNISLEFMKTGEELFDV